MNLQKDNLVIRNATADDASILCNWWNDGKVMAHAGFPNGIGTTEQAVADSLKTDTDLNRRLILEIDGISVGEMNYRTVAESIAQIGIKICNFNQQGKGYGIQFLKMLIDFLFNIMGYKKIILDTNLKNIRAQHVYEKIGFQKVALNVCRMEFFQINLQMFDRFIHQWNIPAFSAFTNQGYERVSSFQMQ